MLPILGGLASVLLVAVVVLLLVSNADFGTDRTTVPTTRCAPFCTATVPQQPPEYP
jgi:hypothetical protein